MSNPVFDNNAIFRDPKKARRQQTQRGAQQPGMVQDRATTATVGYDTDALNRMYGAPSATTAQTGRLTYDDVIMKTGGLLAVVVVMAALTWFVVPDALKMPVLVVGALVGFVLGMVNSFKKVPSPGLIVAYSVAEGAFLGGISWYFETAFQLLQLL